MMNPDEFCINQFYPVKKSAQICLVSVICVLSLNADNADFFMRTLMGFA